MACVWLWKVCGSDTCEGSDSCDRNNRCMAVTSVMPVAAGETAV